MNDRDRRALRFGGLGVGIILVVILIGFPTMDYWDRVNRRVNEAQQRLSRIQEALSQTYSLNRTLEEMRSRATVHPSSESLKEQTARLLQQIERLPAYSDLSIRRVEGLPLRDEDRYYRSGVSMQFGGTLGGLHDLLTQVESSRPKLRVERLTVNTDARDPGRVNGQMVLTGYAVVLKRSNKS